MSTIKNCLDIPESVLSCALPRPAGAPFVCVEGFWLKCGDESPVDVDDYILTDSVTRNLKNLARVVSARYVLVLFINLNLILYICVVEIIQCYYKGLHLLGRLA